MSTVDSEILVTDDYELTSWTELDGENEYCVDLSHGDDEPICWYVNGFPHYSRVTLSMSAQWGGQEWEFHPFPSNWEFSYVYVEDKQ